MNTRTQLIHRDRDRSHESDRQDSSGAADARVALKLAAEGFNAALRADGGGRLTLAALAQLRNRAIHYYQQLHPSVDLARRLPADLRSLHEQPAVDQMFAGLQVAAMAYSNTRVGGDACVEFSRAAIADLCGQACRYTDALLLAAGDADPAVPSTGRERGRRAPALGDGS